MLFCFYVNKGARLLEVNCDKAKMRELYTDFIGKARSSDFSEFKKYLSESGLEMEVINPVYFEYGGEDKIEFSREDAEKLAESEAIFNIGAPHANIFYKMANKRKRTPAQHLVKMLEIYSQMEQLATLIALVERGELSGEFKDLYEEFNK